MERLSRLLRLFLCLFSSALPLHAPVASSKERALADPGTSAECYYSTELLASCDMGSEAQPDDSSAVIEACSQQPGITWYRRNYNDTGVYSYWSVYQCDLIQEINDFDNESDGVMAVSRCTLNPTSLISPSASDTPPDNLRALLTTTRVYYPPDHSSSLALSFWYRLSFGAGNITLFDDLLSVLIDYYDNQGNMDHMINMWQLVESDDDAIPTPEEWHYGEVNAKDYNPHEWYSPDDISPFVSFSFLPHHAGKCQSDLPGATVIALDAIKILAVNNCTKSTLVPTMTALSTTRSPALSPVSVELQRVTNKNAYPDNITYFTQSPSNVLGVIQNAVRNNSLQLTFSDILTIANFFQEFTGAEVPPDLPDGVQNQIVNTLLQITDQILIAEETGKLEAPATSSAGYDAAATIYQSLEDMYNNLPPNEEPYVFNNSLSVAYVHAVLINGSSPFEHLNLTTKMEVNAFNRGAETATSTDDGSGSVASIAFKTEALQEAFEELRQSANATALKFSLSLSAMQSFKFAKFIPRNELNERSSPIVLLASLGNKLKRTDIITISHNVDALFDFPSGARRKHRCIFLNYTSKQWSEVGCRMTAKHAKWDSTTATVECTCDHLTPFSLLLTLCGSLSRSFVPKDKPLTLDLAVVTTATTLVAAVCCLFALFIITIRIWRKSVIFDEVTFTRMGLWVALFGMYIFTIFSQLMVYIPEMCGQKFCLTSGILVHWFTLISVGWTAVQTVRLIQIIRYPEQYGRRNHLPGDAYHEFRLKTLLATTLLPSVFPFLASMPHFAETLAASLGGYGYANHEKWCWLNGEHSWIPWMTFIGPLSAAGVLNVAAVILYIYTMRKRRKILTLREDVQEEETDSVRHRVYGVIINTGLMGLIWLSVWLALFSCLIDQTLQYIFVLMLTVACGSQAVYIIIFQGIIPNRRSRSAHCSPHAAAQTFSSKDAD